MSPEIQRDRRRTRRYNGFVKELRGDRDEIVQDIANSIVELPYV